MDKGTLKEKVKDDGRRCSPRINHKKEQHLTKNDQEGTEKTNISTKDEIKEPLGTQPSASKSPITAKTPDSTQRELKKLEDYWTRHNPVQENSPRLRNNRKTNSDLKEYLGHFKKTEKNKLLKTPKPSIETSRSNANSTPDTLPESPIPSHKSSRHTNANSNEGIECTRERPSQVSKIIPRSEQSSDTLDNKTKTITSESASSTLEHTRTKIAKNIFSEFGVSKFVETCDLETTNSQPSSRRITRSSPAVIPAAVSIQNSFRNNQNSIDIKPKFALPSVYSPIKENKVNIVSRPETSSDETENEQVISDNGSDSDDDDYIPPRKKLRSEVTNDELWEGIPLTISFKRLAPIPRQKDELDGLNINTEDDKQNIPITDSPYINSEGLTQSNTNTELGLDQTFNYAESKTDSDKCCGSISHLQVQIKVNDTVNDLVSNKEQVKKDDTFEDIEQPSTLIKKINTRTPSKKRKYEASLNVKVKRSARLYEKSSISSTKSGYANIADTHEENNKRVKTKNKKTINETICIEPVIQNLKITLNESFTKDIVADNVKPLDLLDTSIKAQQVSGTPLTSSENTRQTQEHRTQGGYETPSAIVNSPEINTVKESISQILDSALDKSKTELAEATEQMTCSKISFEETQLDISYLPQTPPLGDSSSDLTESVSNTLDTIFGPLKENIKTKAESIPIPNNTQTPGTSVESKLVSTEEECISTNTKARNPSRNTNRSTRCSLRLSEMSRPVNIENTDNNRETVQSSDTVNDTSEATAVGSPDKDDMHDVFDEVLSFNEDISKPRVKDPCKHIKFKSDVKEQKKQRTVPPLRIKLKQPLKCVFKKENTLIPKLKQEKSHKKSKYTVKETTKQTEVPQSEANSNKKIKLQGSSKIDKTKTKDKPENKTGKKGFTPKKSQTKKKLNRKSRKWSPPSSLDLRLNNDRRLAAVENLMSNAVLNKHACMLWSSENRRHEQLSNPEASLHELDAIMGRKWETLSEREKLRYFQRAQEASRDENRHSNRRHTEKGELDKKTNNPSVERFLAMDSTIQLLELKNWLQFYREVSPEEYSNVMATFKAKLSEEKEKREKIERQKAKTKYKTKKNKNKSKVGDVEDVDAKYRRMLFETIFENKDKITGIWAEKRKIQGQILRDRYNGTVRRLISGEVIPFSESVKSDRLTEALGDVRTLERERKIAVYGNMINNKPYTEQLERLRTKLSTEKEQIESLLLHPEIDAEKVEEYVKEIGDSEMTPLSPDTVSVILCDVTNHSQSPGGDENLNQSIMSDSLKQSKSASSVLTEWVADDILKANPKLGFREAVSLLSNKVHPCPAFASPQIAQKVSHNHNTAPKMESILLNTNQNNNNREGMTSYHAVKVPYTHERKRAPLVLHSRHMKNRVLNKKYNSPFPANSIDLCHQAHASSRQSFTQIMEMSGNKPQCETEFTRSVCLSAPEIVHGVQKSLSFTNVNCQVTE